MVEVPAAITTSGTLAWVASGAMASAIGVMPKPASTATLSLTTSSCARRLVTSGTPVSSLTISSIFLPATVLPFWAMIELHGGVDLPAGRGLLAGHRQDQADLDGRPAPTAADDKSAAASPTRNKARLIIASPPRRFFVAGY